MGIIRTVTNGQHQTFSDFHWLQLLLNQVPLAHQDDHQMEVIDPNPDSMFCGKTSRKKVKQRGSWTTQPTCKFEFGGGEMVLQVAEQKKRL